MFGEIFQKQKKEGLGLDIGNKCIKLVHVVISINQKYTYHTMQMPISVHLFDTRQKAVIHAIQKLISQLSTTYRKASLAISDCASLNILLSIDVNAPDLKTTALLNAAPFIPVPIDALYFDFQVVKKTKQTQQVLGTFCRKEMIEHQQHLLQRSGVDLTTIEVESHALERSYSYLYHLEQYPDCWACIDISDDKLILLLWEGDFVIESITDALDKPNALQAIKVQVYQQLIRLLGSCTSKTLKALWVSGDHSLCRSLQKEARKMLEMIDHPNHIYRHLNDNEAEKALCGFDVALGLALRNIE